MKHYYGPIARSIANTVRWSSKSFMQCFAGLEKAVFYGCFLTDTKTSPGIYPCACHGEHEFACIPV